MVIDWNQEYEEGKDFTPFSTQQINRILKHADLKSQNTCIDLGCGTGLLTREFFHRGFKEVLGIDNSNSALEIARRSTTQDITYIQKDLCQNFTKDLPNNFDLALCASTLAFIDDREVFIDKISTLLGKNSVFVLVVPYPPAYQHKQNIIMDSHKIITLLSRRFNIIIQYVETNNQEIFIAKLK